MRICTFYKSRRLHRGQIRKGLFPLLAVGHAELVHVMPSCKPENELFTLSRSEKANSGLGIRSLPYLDNFPGSPLPTFDSDQ